MSSIAQPCQSYRQLPASLDDISHLAIAAEFSGDAEVTLQWRGPVVDWKIDGVQSGQTGQFSKLSDFIGNGSHTVTATVADPTRVSCDWTLPVGWMDR